MSDWRITEFTNSCDSTFQFTLNHYSKIQEYRHPVNNYRFYRKSELESINRRLSESRIPQHRRPK